MSEKTTATRRDLLQKTALAAGVAALAVPQSHAQSSETNEEPAWKRLFPPGFRNERIKTSGAEINTVIGGSGPPVLLFHGAPQSLITWRIIAPDLAKEYTLVMCDLRGYGDSSKPPDGENHANHSKRAMALDGVEVMQHLGYQQFRMVGHDRGGRVGRRMALEHPDRVTKLAVLDIVPAHYLYSHFKIEFVQAYFHWFNFLRKPPGPEDELLKMNQAFLKGRPTISSANTCALRPRPKTFTPCAKTIARRRPSTWATITRTCRPAKKSSVRCSRFGPRTAPWASCTTCFPSGKKKA